MTGGLSHATPNKDGKKQSSITSKGQAHIIDGPVFTPGRHITDHMRLGGHINIATTITDTGICRATTNPNDIYRHAIVIAIFMWRHYQH